jgi:hypothetical protein
MENAKKAKLAQEATLRDEPLAMRVATEVARALNLSVRTTLPALGANPCNFP